MAGTITQTQFVQRVLRRINEAANSAVGTLADGTSSTPTLTTTQAIADYATEGVQLLTRTVFPLVGGFTISLAVGKRRALYGDFTPIADETAAGSVLWGALTSGVAFTPNAGTQTALRFCSEAMLSLRYRNYLSDPTGSPLVWYMAAAGGVIVYPATDTAGTLTVRGLYISAPAATGGGVLFSAIPDDIMTSVIEPFVCGRICQKNTDDPVLASRAPGWLAEFETNRKALYDRLDYGLRAYFPPFTPITIAAGK